MSDPIEKTSRKILISVIVGLVAIVGVVYTQTQANGEVTESEQETSESSSERSSDGEEADAPELAPIPVDTVVVTQGSIASYLSATANLIAEDDIKILAESEGRVVELRVEEGDTVQKGQVLATLDRSDARIALDKAKDRAANALMIFQRAQKARSEELISSEQFDQLAMEHRMAQHEVAEAEWEIARRTVAAPIDGRITDRALTVGQRVQPNDELFGLANFDSLIARIYLPERDVLGLKEGREVSISLTADQELEFGGFIRQISPVVDVATGTVKITIEATQPPGQVRPGGFVGINIERQRHHQATLLPRDAVIRELQSAHVFVVAENTATERKVELGLEEGTQVQILSGLEPGEVVVIAGQGGLEDGALVKTTDPTNS